MWEKKKGIADIVASWVEVNRQWSVVDIASSVVPESDDEHSGLM